MHRYIHTYTHGDTHTACIYAWICFIYAFIVISLYIFVGLYYVWFTDPKYSDTKPSVSHIVYEIH